MPERMVVYTALFGDYDHLVEPFGSFEDCDFICFTDQADLNCSKHWRVILVKDCHFPPVLMNRMYKILPHRFLQEYDLSLYVDSNIKILSDPSKIPLFSEGGAHNIIIPSHFSRKCLYDEAFVLIRSGRVDIQKVFKRMFSFMSSGYFCQTNMGENNIIFRRHNLLIDFSEYWWSIFIEGPHRDQLSLAYVSWKMHTPVLTSSKISSRGSVYFSIKKHKHLFQRSGFHHFYLLLFFAIPYYVFIKLYATFFILKRLMHKLLSH